MVPEIGNYATVAAACCGLLACGASGNPAQPSACPLALYDGTIDVPATDATMSMSVRVAASGTDDSGSIAVEFADNQGTVDFWGTGPVPALLYTRDPNPENGYTLIGGLAATDGAWMIFWLYCAPDGTLGGFAGERTDRSEMLLQNMTGTCDISSVNWNLPVQIPAHSLRNIPMTCGFTVSEAPADGVLDLQSGQPGTAS